MERIFAHHISSNRNRRFISKVDEELPKLNSKKTNNLIKNWAKDLNRHFTQRRYKDKHIRRCSTSLAIRAKSYDHTPIRMNEMKNILTKPIGDEAIGYKAIGNLTYC